MSSRPVDEIGNKHGLLTVVAYAGSKNKMALWECVCECGGTKIVAGKLLRSGNTHSCGCLKVNKIQGKRFGRLMAVEATEERRSGNICWKCLCDCGKTIMVDSTKLVGGYVRSCGCLRRDVHWDGYEDIGMTYFNSIKYRAEQKGFEFTITIEGIWKLFDEQDRKCALSGLPIDFRDKTASLDRVDSSKGYVEGNVQWLHKNINRMKMDHSVEDFLFLCNCVVTHNS